MKTMIALMTFGFKSSAITVVTRLSSLFLRTTIIPGKLLPSTTGASGLENATKAANLNTLLRALATYAAGPYIRTNITEATTSLQDVRKELMKYLEIELTDFTALEWFEIKRRPTERPLVFYMHLKYHMSKHLLKSGDIFQGTTWTSDNQMSPRPHQCRDLSSWSGCIDLTRSW